MPRPLFDTSALILMGLAAVFAVVAYLKDPGLPALGARTGFSMLWFILPRMIPALILAGMLQVVIPQETVARYFGRQSGISAILMASAAGTRMSQGVSSNLSLLMGSESGKPTTVLFSETNFSNFHKSKPRAL